MAGEACVSSLSLADVGQILAKMHSARALAMAACTSRLWRSAADLAYRDMCISTGRKVDWDEMPSLAARQKINMTYPTECMQPTADCSADTDLLAASTTTSTASWRQTYFEQTYALSFNGINDYALLPNGVLRQHSLRPGLDAGYTIDMMFLAYSVTDKSALDVDVQTMVPGGGMLLGLQDREFGRSRRAARLFSFPLLYVGLSGHMYSAVGLKSRHVLADGNWHRITLTVVNKVVQEGIASACLYVDGVIDAQNHDIHPEHASLYHLPSYAVLGSGITEGHWSGGSVPVYNCHTFHGLIDEFRIWSRTLEAFEVQELAWRRICSHHDMPYAHHMIGSWSLTEGRGRLANDHVKQTEAAVLGAVSIPSAHHTYGSVSNLVHSLPAQARESCGPTWVNSTAPVEGELIVEFWTSKVPDVLDV